MLSHLRVKLFQSRNISQLLLQSSKFSQILFFDLIKKIYCNFKRKFLFPGETLSLEISHTKCSTKGCTIESRKRPNTGLDVLWRTREGRLQSGESKGISFAWNMLMWIFHCSFSFLSNMLQILILSGHPSSQNTEVSTMSVNGCSFAVTSAN